MSEKEKINKKNNPLTFCFSVALLCLSPILSHNSPSVLGNAQYPRSPGSTLHSRIFSPVVLSEPSSSIKCLFCLSPLLSAPLPLLSSPPLSPSLAARYTPLCCSGWSSPCARGEDLFPILFFVSSPRSFWPRGSGYT